MRRKTGEWEGGGSPKPSATRSHRYRHPRASWEPGKAESGIHKDTQETQDNLPYLKGGGDVPGLLLSDVRTRGAATEPDVRGWRGRRTDPQMELSVRGKPCLVVRTPGESAKALRWGKNSLVADSAGHVAIHLQERDARPSPQHHKQNGPRPGPRTERTAGGRWGGPQVRTALCPCAGRLTALLG